AGARVLGIGRLAIDDAVAAVAPVVHHDSETQRLDLLASYLVVPEVLHARGVIESMERVAVVLAPARGPARTLTLEPLRDATGIQWIEARPAKTKPPLCTIRNDEPFWFEHLPERRAVYFQYNEVTNLPDRTLREF